MSTGQSAPFWVRSRLLYRLLRLLLYTTPHAHSEQILPWLLRGEQRILKATSQVLSHGPQLLASARTERAFPTLAAAPETQTPTLGPHYPGTSGLTSLFANCPRLSGPHRARGSAALWHWLCSQHPRCPARCLAHTRCWKFSFFTLSSVMFT